MPHNRRTFRIVSYLNRAEIQMAKRKARTFGFKSPSAWATALVRKQLHHGAS